MRAIEGETAECSFFMWFSPFCVYYRRASYLPVFYHYTSYTVNALLQNTEK